MHPTYFCGIMKSEVNTLYGPDAVTVVLFVRCVCRLKSKTEMTYSSPSCSGQHQEPNRVTFQSIHWPAMILHNTSFIHTIPSSVAEMKCFSCKTFIMILIIHMWRLLVAVTFSAVIYRYALRHAVSSLSLSFCHQSPLKVLSPLWADLEPLECAP